MLLSRIGPIALEGPLGGSADSNVLRGVHVERNMKMAVKLLPRELVNRPMGGDTFADDVKRLQKLVHPGIARYYGGAMDNGQPYLAMELVHGESLRTMLDRRGRLPWETMVDVADAVCAALAYAHNAGVVHQRLTPARVLVTEAGGVKLVGFDCVLADRDAVLGLRSPMNVAHYLAPEEFRGKQSAELPTCDLFSLGVILYECLTGELPWQSETPSDLVRRRRAGPAPRVSSKVLDCPVWLDVLVAKLLETKREDRLQSAEATHRAIVDAKQKVAAGMGAVQHAWSGRQGALATGVDRKGIDRLRKKQVAVREQDDSPWYERAWFLALCLAAVIAGGVWSMWPESEDSLFAKAKPLMESTKTADWVRAEGILDEIRERFPESPHNNEIAAFDKRYAMFQATQRIRNFELTGRLPDTEIERRYAEAWRYERFGDRLTAWQQYDALVKAFPESDHRDDQAYIDLARQRIAKIKSSADAEGDLTAIVRDKLTLAERKVAAKQPVAARAVLESIVTLYDGNQEVQPLVDEARQRIAELHGGLEPAADEGARGGDDATENRSEKNAAPLPARDGN